MREAITGAEFSRHLADFERSAWRFEHQPSYDVGYEEQDYRNFLAGRPTPPTGNPRLNAWLTQVARNVSRGRTVGRVRIVDEPPTDYQRWMLWMDRWNRESGERIDYLTRRRALDVGLPASGDEEWWLIDDARLLVTRYEQGRPSVTHMVDDETDVNQARLWRDLAIRTARIDHTHP